MVTKVIQLVNPTIKVNFTDEDLMPQDLEESKDDSQTDEQKILALFRSLR